MVFLNDNFIKKNKAYISVMDRGFLFGDGVYEVIPVYSNKIFQAEQHLERLQKSLKLIKLTNPYSKNKWLTILNKLKSFSTYKNQILYLQITRGIDKERKYNFGKLSPTTYAQTSHLVVKTKKELAQGFSAITEKDIRWHKCYIKSTSLLASVMYAQQAQDNKVAEIILYQDNKVTEGATSNVFIIKDNILFTSPHSNNILPGITRNLVLKSAKTCNIEIKQEVFSLSSMFLADEVFITSSTREIMPITSIDNKLIAQGKTGSIWQCIYDNYQKLKND